jgi:predicted outer membrane repeat protein
MSNTANGDGGGIYAQGSTINLDNDAELISNIAGTAGSGSGGGAYLDNSYLYADKASISNNTAQDFGGGIYATNSSVVDMDLGPYTCLSTHCSKLYANTATNIMVVASTRSGIAASISTTPL